MEFCNSASKAGATLDGKLPQGRTRRSTEQAEVDAREHTASHTRSEATLSRPCASLGPWRWCRRCYTGGLPEGPLLSRQEEASQPAGLLPLFGDLDKHSQKGNDSFHSLPPTLISLTGSSAPSAPRPTSRQMMPVSCLRSPRLTHLYPLGLSGWHLPTLHF